MKGQGVMMDGNEITSGIWNNGVLQGTGLRQEINHQDIFSKGEFKEGKLHGDSCEIVDAQGRFVG